MAIYLRVFVDCSLKKSLFGGHLFQKLRLDHRFLHTRNEKKGEGGWGKREHGLVAQPGFLFTIIMACWRRVGVRSGVWDGGSELVNVGEVAMIFPHGPWIGYMEVWMG